RPLLPAHPAADRWTTIEAGQPFFDRIRGPKALVMPENCGHLPVGEPGVSRLEEAVVEFLGGLSRAYGGRTTRRTAPGPQARTAWNLSWRLPARRPGVYITRSKNPRTTSAASCHRIVIVVEEVADLCVQILVAAAGQPGPGREPGGLDPDGPGRTAPRSV